MLLETRGDYEFAESVRVLSREFTKFNETLKEELIIKENFMNSLKQLTEALEGQYEQNRKLMMMFEKRALQ